MESLPSGTIKIEEVERKIDEIFESNELTKIQFSQSAWTVLSIAEELYFKSAIIDRTNASQAAIFADVLINSLTHPLRSLHILAPKNSAPLNRSLIDEHYRMAHEWIREARDYNQFCAVFPLFRKGMINLQINEGNTLYTNWESSDLRYEAYDRFIRKSNSHKDSALNPNIVAKDIQRNLRMSGGIYSIEFTRTLVSKIRNAFSPSFTNRHILPDNWEFSRFSISQYRAVFILLQCMAAAWFVARQFVAASGASDIAYSGAVWTLKKSNLIALIARGTGLPKTLVGDVIRYLTFGEIDIKKPDIAIQPIVDLANGQYAISPFVLMNTDAERNLCVLLNKVPSDRSLYSKLIDEKETQQRGEIIEILKELGLSFKSGKLRQTDIDLAVINHKTKCCLCIELKWFIEPAEIREVIDRSKELEKGVKQANTITDLFINKNTELLSLLGIDPTYDFLAIVGSANFIGRSETQDKRIPIIRIWHLLEKIKATNDLSHSIKWLRDRTYLPRENQEYKVCKMPIESGDWKLLWYGFSNI